MANYSLNLRNLPLGVSEGTLRQFYGKVGKIRDVRVVTNKAAAPNFFAFAFVDFVTADSCARALTVDPSPLGPSVEAKFATKRGVKAAAKSAEPGLPPPLEVADLRSLVMTGTSARITEELFRKFCAQFGEVESLKMTHKSHESRAFVRFTEEKFAKACVSQRDRVIDDDILIFIRPAAEANEPLYWNSNVMTRVRSFFNSEEGDEEMCEDIFNLTMNRKADQDALKAKLQDEEEYQPGDADANRRCRRVFVPLESDCEGGSDGAEADDEALNFEEHEDADKLEEYTSRFQLQSSTEEKDEDEWPSCDSTEGQRIQSLVCPVPEVSFERPPAHASRVVSPPASDLSGEDTSLIFRRSHDSWSESVSSPDFSESSQLGKPKANFFKLGQVRPHLSGLMANSSSSGNEFPSPLTPRTNPSGLFRSRGLNANAGIPIVPGSSNSTPLTLGRGQRTVTPLGSLGRGRRS